MDTNEGDIFRVYASALKKTKYISDSFKVVEFLQYELTTQT